MHPPGPAPGGGNPRFVPSRVGPSGGGRSLDAATRQRLNRLVLVELIATADPARLVHHALEAGDLASIIEFAPQAARAAMEVGSVRVAGAHFRALEPHLDLIPRG